MEFKIKMPDEIGEENAKKLIEGLDSNIENMRKKELIDKPIKEFLQGKYPNSFVTAYWMDYDDNCDFVSYLEVEFNHRGKEDSKDLFNRIVKCQVFDEYIKLKHEVYDYHDSFEVITDSIRNVDQLKELFRKSLKTN